MWLKMPEMYLIKAIISVAPLNNLTSPYFRPIQRAQTWDKAKKLDQLEYTNMTGNW